MAPLKKPLIEDLKKLLIEDIKDAFADGRARLNEPGIKAIKFTLGGVLLTADGFGSDRLYVTLPDGNGTSVSYEILSARTLLRLHKIICR